MEVPLGPGFVLHPYTTFSDGAAFPRGSGRHILFTNSHPNRHAVASVHSSSPNGQPRSRNRCSRHPTSTRRRSPITPGLPGQRVPPPSTDHRSRTAHPVPLTDLRRVSTPSALSPSYSLEKRAKCGVWKVETIAQSHKQSTGYCRTQPSPLTSRMPSHRA